jgi:rare lipoprotein A (peptidoglycan hydrolase)
MRGAAVACAVAIAAAAGSATAAHGSAHADRAAAAATMRRLDRLSSRRAVLVRAESAARSRLASARAEVTATGRAVAFERSQLVLARAQLAAAVVGDYKAGTPDPAAYVLDSVSLSDLAARVDILGRIDTSETALVGRIQTAAGQLRRERASFVTAAATARSQLRVLRATRARIDAAIAGRRRLLASITARIRAEVAREQARRSRLAARNRPSRPSGGTGFSGEASWYGPGFAGHRTADGEIFDPQALTAASPWLPFNTIVRVTSSVTGRSVTVRINDRGPFGRGVLDLSAHAARLIGLQGWTEVHVQVLSQP